MTCVILLHVYNLTHRPLASPPISSTPRTPPVRLRLHKKLTFKFKVNRNKSKIKNTSLNLTNQHKRTTQPKLTNYIHTHLDSGFTPSNSTHGHHFVLSLLIIFIIISSSSMKQNKHFVSLFSNYYPFIIS